MLSVVIPALNAARHLPRLPRRARGAGEVIVVDGGSSDGHGRSPRERARG
jgi:glycosyltransferase involved in cell wall biosynthesis